MSREQTGDDGNALLRRIVRGARGTLLIRVGGLVVGYGTSVILARVLGAEDFGAYRYALGWTTLLAVAATLGADVLSVRQIASNASPGAAAAVVRFARGLTLGTATVTAVIAGVVGYGVVQITGPSTLELPVFLLALLVLVATAVAGVYRGALESLGAVVRSQWPDVVVRQGGLLAAACVMMLVGSQLSAESVMLAHAATAFAALACLVVLWRTVRPAETPEDTANAPTLRPWISAAVPIALVALLAAVNTQADLLVLGMFESKAEVGRYAVAARLAVLVSYALIAANVPLRPVVARLHGEGRKESLQEALSKTSALVLIASGILATGIWLFTQQILSVFGPEYAAAGWPLRILSAAQLINATAGPVGIVLIMTGHERATLLGLTIGAMTNVILNLVLIPRYGSMGAAVATGASVIVWNGLLAGALMRRTGLHTTAWGAWKNTLARGSQ